jgi:hypothetical protein
MIEVRMTCEEALAPLLAKLRSAYDMLPFLDRQFDCGHDA